VPLEVDLSVAYTLGHYSEEPLVDMALASLTYAPKFKYMMYIEVEPEEY